MANDTDGVLRGVVVGCGMGGSSFLKGFSEMEGFELSAVVDMSEETLARVREEYGCENLYTDYGTCFAEVKPDIVSVHTYPPSHHLVVEEALKHDPKGLITDKPLGDTVAHGRRIVELIKERGLPVQVPHGHALKPAAEQAMHRVWEGAVGTLRTVEIQCVNWDIMSAGIHWLHYFVLLIRDDPIDWVMCATESSARTYRDGMQVGTTEIAYIQTKSGVRCILHTGDEVLVNSDFSSMSYRMIGSDGVVEWGLGRGIGNSYRIQNRENPEPRPVTPDYNQDKLKYLTVLAEQIRSGKPDYANIDASLSALELVCAAYIAGEKQVKIEFPWDDARVAALKKDEEYWPGKPYPGTGGGRDGKTYRKYE